MKDFGSIFDYVSVSHKVLFECKKCDWVDYVPDAPNRLTLKDVSEIIHNHISKCTQEQWKTGACRREQHNVCNAHGFMNFNNSCDCECHQLADENERKRLAIAELLNHKLSGK